MQSLQSGLYYGYADMVDGIVTRIKAVVGDTARVIATGGQAPLIAKASRHIRHHRRIPNARRAAHRVGAKSAGQAHAFHWFGKDAGPLFLRERPKKPS